MDFKKLIARVKGILLSPRTEWPMIASEPATVADLYKGYIIWLAAIPAVFTFVSLGVIGVNVPFAGTVRIGAGSALTNAVLQYVLALGVVYLMAIIIEMLAPTFGAQKDRVQALKTVAYSYTAAWVAGVTMIVPPLAFVVGLAALVYSIYLLYLGLPYTMKCPPDKAAGYTAVAIIAGIVLSFVATAVVSTVTGVGSTISGSSIFNTGDDVKFEENSALGKLEQWGKDMEQASERLDAAQRSGDEEAASEAMAQMAGAALGGGGKVEALAPERLKSFVPDSLDGLPRADLSTERSGAMGLQVSHARATYSNDSGRTLNLDITDTGSAKGFLALAEWAGVESESESDGTYEKTYRNGGRLVNEKWDRSSSWGEYTVVVGERFTVKVDGQAESIDDLRAAVGDLDLSGLEALKHEGVAEY